jgi:hypothetical protein
MTTLEDATEKLVEALREWVHVMAPIVIDARCKPAGINPNSDTARRMRSDLIALLMDEWMERLTTSTVTPVAPRLGMAGHTKEALAPKGPQRKLVERISA